MDARESAVEDARGVTERSATHQTRQRPAQTRKNGHRSSRRDGTTDNSCGRSARTSVVNSASISVAPLESCMVHAVNQTVYSFPVFRSPLKAAAIASCSSCPSFLLRALSPALLTHPPHLAPLLSALRLPSALSPPCSILWRGWATRRAPIRTSSSTSRKRERTVSQHSCTSSAERAQRKRRE